MRPGSKLLKNCVVAHRRVYEKITDAERESRGGKKLQPPAVCFCLVTGS